MKSISKKTIIIIIIIACAVIALAVFLIIHYNKKSKNNNAVIGPNGTPVAANLTKEELIVQNQALEARVKQLEQTTQDLTGGIPKPQLYPLSGIAISKNTISQNFSTISVLPMALDVNNLNIDLEKLLLNTGYGPNQKTIEVEVSPETKITLTPALSKEEKEKSSQFGPGRIQPLAQEIPYNQFQGGAWPPYPVMIQTKTENPQDQQKIKASELTIFMLPPSQSQF